MMQTTKTKKQPYEHDTPITHTLRDSWEYYRNKMMNKDKPYLSEKEYRAICYAFLIELSKKIIKESFEYKIPASLGYLRIRKGKLKFQIKDGRLKPSKKIIDWGNTRKVWYKKYPGLTLTQIKEIPDKPLVLYTNEHTNGEVMRWYWNKETCRVKNKTVYLFKPTKTNRKNLKKWINNEFRENDYAF